MRKLTLKLDTQTLPKCPHCERDIDTISYNELAGARFGKRYVYFCPSCRKTLGVSHRKGFWMG